MSIANSAGGAMTSMRASILAVALGVVLAPGAAASPGTGYRDIQDFANAGFRQTIAECIDANPTVHFAAGDVQNPLGSGKPASWSDVVVQLRIYDTCQPEPEQLLWYLEGVATVTEPDVERFEHVSLDEIAVRLFDATGSVWVDAVVDLTWTGNDDATERIDHQLANGYFRQERYVSAQIDGTLEFADSAVWDAGITFTASDVEWATIGRASEIAIK